MNGECESCAALKAQIVELEKRAEELKEKVNPSFFLWDLRKHKVFFYKAQKMRWHTITRHHSHFRLKKIAGDLMNCMRMH